MRTCIAAVAAVLVAAPAAAQTYPSRAISVVVPFPAGGPSDVVARIVADHMGRVLGQTLVIENVGGAGGTIGSARVAAAAPDGYTLLAGSMGSHVAAPVLTPNVRYDPAQAFEAIGPTAHAPAVIVARTDFPADDLRAFITLARNNGAAIKQAHGGVGSSSHMACLLFSSAAGISPTQVAYRGTGPALNDLLGGHVDYFCEQAVSVTGAISSGTVKAYAVSSPQRLATLPNVPTASELGLDYDMNIWSGMFAPKGTPADVVQKLNAALDQSLDDSGVQKRIAELGGTIPPKADRAAAKFEAYVKAEIARWSPILKAAGAKATN